MTETLLSGRVLLHLGDCRAVLAEFAPDSIDAVVTDPPYGLNFMGKDWDHGAVAFDPATWRAALRVLKPGGHLLAMGGTRTFHRLACAIEDAGFEVRDMVSWLYGSGFPKSHDVSKGIDKAAGAEREVVGRRNLHSRGNHEMQDGWRRPWMDDPDAVERSMAATAPATDAARQWDGWGTALKPALEPICMARKPLIGTVAANVLEHGTGAINVDGCRIATDESLNGGAYSGGDKNAEDASSYYTGTKAGEYKQPTGRWPANVIHDGSEEVTAAFPDAGGGFGKRGGNEDSTSYGFKTGTMETVGYGDSGSAARFFYSAKADADDRLGSKHPTVKPLDLMQWLVRLVTPKGGTVLDPFAGTGTTGEAAYREGMRAVLIERETEYQADIRRRMALVLAGPDERSRESIKAKNLPRDDGPLFSRETWAEMWAKPFDFSQEPKGNPG